MKRTITTLLAAFVAAVLGGFGLASAATATETPDPAPQYVTLLWQPVTEGQRFPQQLVAWRTASPDADLHALDSKATCGTYQADVVNYTEDWQIAKVDQIVAAGTLTDGGLADILARKALVQPFRTWTTTDGCTPTPTPEPTPTDTPAPPVTHGSTSTPVTSATPKDLSRLSPDQRAQVDKRAKDLGIRAEDQLYEMG